MPSMAVHTGCLKIGQNTGSALCQIAPRECFEGRYGYRFASPPCGCAKSLFIYKYFLFTIANKAD